jgi:hypothetical protein
MGSGIGCGYVEEDPTGFVFDCGRPRLCPTDSCVEKVDSDWRARKGVVGLVLEEKTLIDRLPVTLTRSDIHF